MCKQSFFSNAIYKLFRGNLPEENLVVTCSATNFMGGGGGAGGQLSRVKCSGRNYYGKNVKGSKVKGEMDLEGVSWGSIVQEGNYSGVIQ